MGNLDELADTIYGKLRPPVTSESLKEAYELGMLKKSELEDQAWYLGSCRNSSKAKWHADRERFEYERHKFGSSFMEDIVHPEDDEGSDIFVPVKKIYI